MTERNSSGNSRRKSPPSLLARLARFCAYQERSHQEVRHKLLEEGARGEELEEIISQLITQGFLNEERFARAFAGGKFRTKKWGRIKIENELQSHGLTSRCVRQGLSEIDESDYRKTLIALLDRKWKQTPEQNIFKKRDKVARFLIGKGYEPEMVWERLKERGHKS